MDIYDNPEHLGRLIDILVDMNLYAIEQYAKAGADGLIFCDDWGLQNRLMISPGQVARDLETPLRPHLRRRPQGRHAHLPALLRLHRRHPRRPDRDRPERHPHGPAGKHGPGLLGERFAGRLTFCAPVDIQMTMAHGTLDEIRAYCHKLNKSFNRDNGGFIPRWYTDPTGAGHRPEALAAMSEEFVKIVEANARIPETISRQTPLHTEKSRSPCLRLAPW